MSTTPTPAAPAAATPAAPAAEPKKSSLLSNILGLVAPDQTDVKPDPEAAAKAKADADAKVKADADAKIKADADAKAKADADAAAGTVTEPKKVAVKKRETPAPAPTVSPDDARKIAAEEAERVAKKAADDAAAKARETAVPDDSDLAPEERDELELAKLAEAKDPSRKGLSDKFRKFYQEQKKFLEGRVAEEGNDYDPSTDPEYKKFLTKHEPKLTSTERKTLREEKIATEASTRAMKAAEEKLAPEIEKLRRKTLELEHRPKIHERMGRYAGELADGMPDDVVKFFKENGNDIEKTREAFPDEVDIIVQQINGAGALAEEALALRRGLTSFDAKNDKHQFLDNFIKRQAEYLLTQPAETRVRDGKTFVHPYQFTPEMAGRHWTFDDEDVLGMLKTVAQQEAKARVKASRERLQKAKEAEARRAGAQSGASAAASAAAAPAAPSTRTPPSLTPGAAAPVEKKASAVSRVLGLG